MRNRKSLLVILISLLIFSSSCEESKKENEIFNTYIQENLNVENVSDSHLYFLLPDDACIGLVDTLIPYFKSLSNQNSITIILIGRSKKKLDFVSRGFKNREQIVYDTEGTAYDYNLINPLTPTIYIKISDSIKKTAYPNIDLKKIMKDINAFLKRSDV